MDFKDREQFETANRAFNVFTLSERLMALEEFRKLRYPSTEDRFFEAVHRVVTKAKTADLR